jgi:Domain of unknown function (DUF1918)
VSAHVGDRIVVESERAAQASRAGVIEEVLSKDPDRVRVRWDDGHESIYVPAAGAAGPAEPAGRKPQRPPAS